MAIAKTQKTSKNTAPTLNARCDELENIISRLEARIVELEGNLNQNEILLSEELIAIFDDKFKYHLDRYKYAARYKNANSDKHRSECMEILIELNIKHFFYN